jgi:hypothetical protein
MVVSDMAVLPLPMMPKDLYLLPVLSSSVRRTTQFLHLIFVNLQTGCSDIFFEVFDESDLHSS